MDFLLGLIIAAATSLEGLAVVILIAAAMVIFSAFNATIAFAAGYIVFCIATWLLYVIIICNTNNRFMIITSLAVSLTLGYLAADAVYKSEQAKDAEREVQKQQNMTQQDKVYYIQRSLMFSGYGVTIDGKWGKKTMQASQKYSGSSATSIDELYEAVKAKKEGKR
ncbi:hypothetical protein [uncultured Campylobacter sp.]|uniref:hypothetical protein n=1 Tax=uncultured Campylobacter sp. TaxID=218934 RepID=UPI0026079755|nr:hypothetical protein [uncultured Campylobacter sp.]